MDDQSFASAIDDIVKFYESIGFDRMDSLYRNDDDPATPSDVLRKEHGGRTPNPAHPCIDLEILHHFFNEEVWLCDIECDVCEYNLCYRATLLRLAEISHGAFRPVTIEESWETDEGPITVTFEQDGVKLDIHPKYMYDCLDLNVLAAINKFIAKAARQFEIGGPDQTVTLMCITSEQKRQMIKTRNFPFAERTTELLAVFRTTPFYLG